MASIIPTLKRGQIWLKRDQMDRCVITSNMDEELETENGTLIFSVCWIGGRTHEEILGLSDEDNSDNTYRVKPLVTDDGAFCFRFWDESMDPSDRSDYDLIQLLWDPP